MEGTPSTTWDVAAQRIYAPNVIANSSLMTVKFIAACFSGAVAGILGLENWAGFGFFVVATLFSGICIYFINCRGQPGKYLQGGTAEMVNPGYDNIFSFVLVYTLFYCENSLATLPFVFPS